MEMHEFHLGTESEPVGPGTRAVIDALQIVQEAERRLVASQERNRALVDAAVDAIVSIDEDGIINSYNPAAERLFGYSKNEVIGKNVALLVPSPHRELHDSYIRNYITSGVAKIIGLGREVVGVRKDGVEFPMHLSIGEFQSDGKRHFVGILRDLTERNASDDQLRYYSAIVQSSHDAIIGKNLEGVIVSWNKGAEDLYQYTPAEVIGRHISILVPPGFENEIPGFLERIKKGERIDHFETIRVRKDGSTIHVSLNISPIISRDGEIIGASAIARDISEVIKSKLALENANLELEAQRDETEVQRQELEEINQLLEISCKRAEAATVAKSAFLANMSHEIRTPMTAILGYVDILKETIQSDENAEKYEKLLLPIRRSGEHLMSVINDILDISKIEAGCFDIELNRFSPFALVSEVMELMSVRATTKGLSTKVHCESEIPETILSDSHRLRQVLYNLTGNAIKFTSSGSIILRLKLDTSKRKPLLQFDIEDTGEGMSADALDRIFEPFSQADSSVTRRHGGTGLGLTICRQIVSKLGGEIRVRSTQGIGSSFTFTVETGPLANVALHNYVFGEVSYSTETPKLTKATLPNCKILVVEDGLDNQRLITYLLEKAGATAILASNGQEAIDEVNHATSEFDVILMDMQMPVLDGYEATRRLRAQGYKRPIVALTAHAMSGDVKKCLDAGCDAHVSKPIVKDHFFKIIRDQIEKNSLASNAF